MAAKIITISKKDKRVGRKDVNANESKFLTLIILFFYVKISTLKSESKIMSFHEERQRSHKMMNDDMVL